MAAFEKLLTDAEIERTACALLGIAAARVFLWHPRKDPWVSDEQPQPWYGLWIKPTADADWSLLGLRRTKAELLAFIEWRAAAAATNGLPQRTVTRSQHAKQVLPT